MIDELDYNTILQRLDNGKYFPYENVTDEMIKMYLESEDFIDTKNGNHRGYKDTDMTHAQRIASLINLIKTNVAIDPINIYEVYENEKINYEIDDGHHRLRAYIYLKNIVPFVPCIIWS